MTTLRRLALSARALSCALAAGLALPLPGVARTATPSPAPLVTAQPRPRATCAPPNRAFALRLAGEPLALAQTPDGCYLFVGLATTPGDAHRGVALLHREGRSYALVRAFDTGGTTTHLAMSRDGSLLAASVLEHGVVLLDVARAIGGDPAAVVADLVDPSLHTPGAIAFDADTTHLYASDRVDSAVLAIDVAAARTSVRPALFSHRVPIDLSPVALALSVDGSKLFVVTDTRSQGKNVPEPCRTAYTPGSGIFQPYGTLTVLDLAHADRDGVAPTLARLDAGCTPNDLAVSSDGQIVWVSNHGDRDIAAYDATALSGDAPRAVIAKTTLTFGPDVLGTVGGGEYLIAAGYERTSDLQHDVAVLTRATTIGKSTLRARLQVGRFPRSALGFVDGSGVMVASYSSSSISFFPVAYLRGVLEPPVTNGRGKTRHRASSRATRHP